MGQPWPAAKILQKMVKNAEKKNKLLKLSSTMGLTGLAEGLAGFLKGRGERGTLTRSQLLIVGPVITGEHWKPSHGSNR